MLQISGSHPQKLSTVNVCYPVLIDNGSCQWIKCARYLSLLPPYRGTWSGQSAPIWECIVTATAPGGTRSLSHGAFLHNRQTSKLHCAGAPTTSDRLRGKKHLRMIPARWGGGIHAWRSSNMAAEARGRQAPSGRHLVNWSFWIIKCQITECENRMEGLLSTNLNRCWVIPACFPCQGEQPGYGASLHQEKWLKRKV